MMLEVVMSNSFGILPILGCFCGCCSVTHGVPNVAPSGNVTENTRPPDDVSASVHNIRIRVPDLFQDGQRVRTHYVLQPRGPRSYGKRVEVVGRGWGK